MNLEQLKSELKEKENELKEFMGCNNFGLTWNIQDNKPFMDFYCGKEIQEDYYYCFRCFNKLKICQAEISALKKGIEACEEILNSQQKTTKLGESVLANQNEYSFDLSSPKSYDECSADTPTLIKQAVEQRDKEILEVTNGR